VDIIPAVVLLYVVLNTWVILPYAIRNTLIYIRLYIGYAAVPAHIYVHNTTRVGVHIACIPQETGVAHFIARTRSYTIELYIQIYYRPPQGGSFSRLTQK